MTKSEWSGWSQAVGAVAGIAIAVWLPFYLAHRDRQRRRHGHLETIAVDLLVAERVAKAFHRGKYSAPAYRLPLIGMRDALPALLADGTLLGDEGATLSQFYIDATSFNSSLDAAQRLRDENKQPSLERGRAEKKALLLMSGTKISRYDKAMAVVRRHLPAQAEIRLKILPDIEPDKADE